MPPSFIDLAIPGTVDRVFTYSVPEHLRALARPGVRALAPFGKKTVSGIVVATPESTGVRGIRDIFDVIDEHPLLDDGLMSLAHWISAYYHSPIGEVLRAMLVAGSTGVGKTTVKLAAPVTPEALASLGRSPLQRSILARLGRLAAGGKAALATLTKELGAVSIHPALHELRRKGLITLEEETPYRGSAARTEAVVSVTADDAPRWRRWLDANAGVKRAGKQAEVVRALASAAPGDLPVRGFIRDRRLSPSALATLVRAGIVRAGRREVLRDGAAADGEHREEEREISLNSRQSAALEEILGPVEAGTFGAFLLWGITGSGKTQVYIEAIARALALGRTALVLVPEISLTPQTVGRFRRCFGGRVVMFHSRMSRGERYDAWRQARDGRSSIVIGPRSAVFAPLPNLGLIVVDEEHEPSYKQYDQSPRYNARDAAVVRARQSKAARVRGAATPTVESFANALSGKYLLLELPERADGAKLPSVSIVDMRRSGGGSSTRTAPPGRSSSRPTRSWRTSPCGSSSTAPSRTCSARASPTASRRRRG
jgi:primosomal protein N' (replication factor Y)